jgi:hypothetical protein
MAARQEFELVTPVDGQTIKLWRTKRPPLAERMRVLQVQGAKQLRAKFKGISLIEEDQCAFYQPTEQGKEWLEGE